MKARQQIVHAIVNKKTKALKCIELTMSMVFKEVLYIITNI